MRHDTAPPPGPLDALASRPMRTPSGSWSTPSGSWSTPGGSWSTPSASHSAAIRPAPRPSSSRPPDSRSRVAAFRPVGLSATRPLGQYRRLLVVHTEQTRPDPDPLSDLGRHRQRGHGGQLLHRVIRDRFQWPGPTSSRRRVGGVAESLGLAHGRSSLSRIRMPARIGTVSVRSSRVLTVEVPVPSTARDSIQKCLNSRGEMSPPPRRRSGSHRLLLYLALTAGYAVRAWRYPPAVARPGPTTAGDDLVAVD